MSSTNSGRSDRHLGPSAEGPSSASPLEALMALESRVVECRRCPRLVEWREEVARNKRRSYENDFYWGRPVPGFGDPNAAILVVGLAPAAHGANRTGRMFTGDRSGEWLYRALFRAGLSSSPVSASRDDDLVLGGVWVTAPVKCAPPGNKPTVVERDSCVEYLKTEIDLLQGLRVFVALGQFAFQVICRMEGVSPRPRFAHGGEVVTPAGRVIISSYHVSQQNTFTGKLTEAMLDRVFERAVGRACCR